MFKVYLLTYCMYGGGCKIERLCVCASITTWLGGGIFTVTTPHIDRFTDCVELHELGTYSTFYNVLQYKKKNNILPNVGIQTQASSKSRYFTQLYVTDYMNIKIALKN